MYSDVTSLLTERYNRNVALERLAHATANKGYSPASPLQALVGLRGPAEHVGAHSGRSVMFIDQPHIEALALL